jgi:thiamine monophosphate synthase
MDKKENIEKAATPSCGLYIRIPADFQLERDLRTMRQIFQAINASHWKENFHVMEYAPVINAEKETEKCALFSEICKNNGVVFIIRDDLNMAVSCDADGVIVPDDLKIVEEARFLLGEEKIVGVYGQTVPVHTPHHRLDYIALGDWDQESSNFSKIMAQMMTWKDLNPEKLFAAIGDHNNDHCAALASINVDFIGLSDYAWKYEKGALQAIVNMHYAIDLAVL